MKIIREKHSPLFTEFCSECGKPCSFMVEIGDDPEGTGQAQACLDCLRAALQLAEEVKLQEVDNGNK